MLVLVRAASLTMDASTTAGSDLGMGGGFIAGIAATAGHDAGGDVASERVGAHLRHHVLDLVMTM